MAGTDEPSRLDRHVDALLFGDPIPLDALDPTLLATLRDLRQLNGSPPPHPVFVARLERELMENATRAHAAQSPIAIAGANDRVPERLARSPERSMLTRAARPVAWAATAALLVLTLAASFGIPRLGSMRQNAGDAPLRAGQTGDITETCQVQPRQAVPAPPRTGISRGILPSASGGGMGILDTWYVAILQEDAQPADPETVARITELLGDLAACLNRPDVDPAQVFALFTDTYLFFALDMPAMSPPRDIAGPALRERLATLPLPPFGLEELDIEGVWMFPDGEAGAVVRTHAGTAYYVFFTWAGDRWLIDELALYPFPEGFVPPVGTPPLVESPLELAAVTMFDILYVPNDLTIPADTAVTLALTNAGQVDHTFVIDALGIDVRLQPGETKTITIEASPGVYDYLCVIPGHRGAGMIGTMTAVSSETTPFATPAA